MLLFLIFSYLWVITYYTLHIKLSSLFIVIGGVALAELLVGPVVYSLASKLSPSHLKGSMMGVVTIGYAAANHLAGYLAHLMVPQEGALLENSLEIYRGGFKTILMVLAGAIIIILIGRSRASHGAVKADSILHQLDLDSHSAQKKDQQNFLLNHDVANPDGIEREKVV